MTQFVFYSSRICHSKMKLERHTVDSMSKSKISHGSQRNAVVSCYALDVADIYLVDSLTHSEQRAPLYNSNYSYSCHHVEGAIHGTFVK